MIFLKAFISIMYFSSDHAALMFQSDTLMFMQTIKSFTRRLLNIYKVLLFMLHWLFSTLWKDWNIHQEGSDWLWTTLVSAVLGWRGWFWLNNKKISSRIKRKTTEKKNKPRCSPLTTQTAIIQHNSQNNEPTTALFLSALCDVNHLFF